MRIRIGTRGSQLALWQAHHVAALIVERDRSLAPEIVPIKTTGDKILDVPLSRIGGKGLFTKELEEAMVREEVDLAVHSLKDVPVVLPEGFELPAILEREDPRDCFISHRYPDLFSLPPGARVGTTSLRRTMLLGRMRRDLCFVSLRGNVQTRLEKLRSGELEAIVLASAGIHRLGLWGSVETMQPMETETMIPAMGQAALGIEVRSGSEFLPLLSSLAHQKSTLECRLERDFVRVLEGGCQVPIGVFARQEESRVTIRAIVGMGDGSEVMTDEGESDDQESAALGESLALGMIQKGARELLHRAMLSAQGGHDAAMD